MKKLIFAFIGLSLLATGCNYKTAMVTDEPTNTDQIQQGTRDEEGQPNMATWKTYRNDKLGFQFQYPPEYKLVENPKDVPVPEDNPNLYKDTVVYLSNQDEAFTPGSTYGQLYIIKRRSSERVEYGKMFSLFLTEMTSRVPAMDPQYKMYQFSYFSGDASSIFHSFMLSNYQPTSPADRIDTPTDLLIAHVNAGYNGDVIPAITIPDWIARTMQFTK